TSPSARGVPCMTGTGQNVVLFGGANGPGGVTALNDTWTWNGSNWTHLQPAASPPARLFPVCVWDSDRQRVVLVEQAGSGSTPRTPLECWTFDGITWSRLVTATAPGTRDGEALAYDPRQHELVLFGGKDSFSWFDDTWTLAVAGEQDTFGAGCPGNLG